MTTTKNLIFPGINSHFSMIFYKILKFHDISMTGKAPIIFQGFPGAVGTLTDCSWTPLAPKGRNWTGLVKLKLFFFFFFFALKIYWKKFSYILLSAVTPFHQDLIKFWGEAALTAVGPPLAPKGRNWTGFVKLKFSVFLLRKSIERNLATECSHTIPPGSDEVLGWSCPDCSWTPCGPWRKKLDWIR